VRAIYPQIQALGAEVLAVTFVTPSLLAVFQQDMPQPFPVVSDPERKVYETFDLGQTNTRGLLRLGVIWAYLRLMLRGWLPKVPSKNTDVWQLGGDFVLDRAQRLLFAHPSQDATDRPSNDALLDALRNASRQSGNG